MITTLSVRQRLINEGREIGRVYEGKVEVREKEAEGGKDDSIVSRTGKAKRNRDKEREGGEKERETSLREEPKHAEINKLLKLKSTP